MKTVNNPVMLRAALLLAILLPLAACGEDEETDACADEGAGAYTVNVYGEEYIEDAIPADVFADGWSVTFDTFLIHLQDVTGARASCGGGLDAPAGRVFDVSASSGGEGFEVATAMVPGGAYNEVGYRIAPADANATAGNASADQVTMMMAEGYSVFASGTATKDGVTKTFAWGFTTDTLYAPCQSTATVATGGAGASQLTIHGDHLFYDDLFSEEPNVAFQLIADADGDGDGEVTVEELAALDITAQERYQVGSADVDNLFDFIAFLTRTLGHIDGEGHCETNVE